MRRPICVALSASVLLYTAGCVSPMDRAEGYRAQVAVGMTAAGVISALGEADAKVKDEAGVMWVYEYESGAGFLYWTGVITLILLVIPLILLSKSSGGGGSLFGTTGVFRLHLKDGRVDWISPVEPAK